MRLPFRIPTRAWILIPICAFGFILWGDLAREKRVEFVSNVARQDPAINAASPTGYADGKRWLIVPEHNNPTYQWLEETQLMAARGDWRVRSVDYENAPYGREVHAASPYRWWLVLLAWVDHKFSGRPIGLGIERAALFADPTLHLLLLVAATVFVARKFGAMPAALFSLGIAALFPFSATFLPGVANDFGLTQICGLWSVLLLVAGFVDSKLSPRMFFAAGVAGGCGLWLNTSLELPLLIGVGAGAAAAALLVRSGAKAMGIPPWRAWAYGGAVTNLAAYLIEYFPSEMGPQLRVNYPLYGIAWLGLGELLWRLASWTQGGKPFATLRGSVLTALAAAALASLPIGISRSGNRDFLAGDLLSNRLTNLPAGAVAASFRDWILRDGQAGAVAATCVPLLLLIPALWFLTRAKLGAPGRTAIAVALGVVAVAVVLAFHQLRWWNTVDVALLGTLVAAAATIQTQPGSRTGLWLLAAPFAGAAILGSVQMLPAATGESVDFKFTRAEVEGLYERALSQWIADHAGPDGATVLVPPIRTSSFCFYGGLRGLGTQNWENRDGLSATFRIVNSTRPDETEALITQRAVTHIVVPSWDSDLDDFARMGLKQPMDSFIYALHRTDGGIFTWLRALPYNLPAISGFDDQSVLVLQVTEESDPATLRSRLVEYLVEMHQIDQAAYSSKALQRYPGDLSALVALAQLSKAKGDDDGFSKVFASLISNLSSGSDRSLPFDRRVSLAVVLALGGRGELSLAQANRCLKELDDPKLRYLTTGSLYHLLVLFKHFDLMIADPNLRALSLKLLPTELRERL